MRSSRVARRSAASSPTGSVRRPNSTTLPFLLLALLAPTNCSLFRARLSGDVQGSALRAEPPEAWSAPRTLTVVTYNVHDLYVVSDHRAARLREIGRQLAARSPDVVCLQEGFVRGDVRGLLEELRAVGLHHRKAYPSGALGSGLWVVSRFPIEEAWFWKFTENGHWWEFLQGDWWAGKGVALARLRLSGQEFLDVFDTHFIAGYPGDSNLEDRWVQAGEAARFVRRASVPSIPALFLGDFNASPGSECYRALVSVLDLEALPEPGWLDHVFFVPGAGAYSAEVEAFESVDGTVEVEGETVGLSDHSGRLVRLRLVPTSTGSE